MSLSPTIRATYEAMLAELRSLDPAEEDLDPQSVAEVIANISLCLALDAPVVGCGL